MARTPRIALAASAACAVGVTVLGALRLLVPAVHARDVTAQQPFHQLAGVDTTYYLKLLAHSMDPGPYAVAGVALALVAILRRRSRVAVAILVLFIATGLTTALLKHLLHQGVETAPAAFPSGHATAVMTFALCAVLAAPARLRPVAAILGAGYAAALSFSILALDWHTPVDVLGGYLVAGTWIAATIALLLRLDPRAEVARRALLTPEATGTAGVVLAAAAIAGLAVTARAGDPVSLAEGHSTAVVAAVGIAVLAAALPAWAARTTR